MAEELLYESKNSKVFVKDDENLKTRVIKRSEEHTSELQSHNDLVCRLLPEKKKLINHQS